MIDSATLIRNFENVSRELYRAGDASGSSAEPVGMRNGREARYGQAYQALVRAGLAPQLRRRYRRG